MFCSLADTLEERLLSDDELFKCIVRLLVLRELIWLIEHYGEVSYEVIRSLVLKGLLEDFKKIAFDDRLSPHPHIDYIGFR